MLLKDQQRFEQISTLWITRAKGFITHMNLRIEGHGPDGVTVRMPFNPAFCIDEPPTLLHGGVLTALLDSVFGLVNFIAIDDISTMATLDLRVDYLRPAQSRADVLVRAKCYHQTRHIAFNYGVIWFDDDKGDEVARGCATFALTRGERNLFDIQTTPRKPE